MPGNYVHTMAGLAVGMITFFSLEDEQFISDPAVDFSVAAIAGSIGGKLPDILEPAISPNHRALFHSWPALALSLWLMHRLYKWQPKTDPERQWRKVIIALCAGYSSHLFLDSLTKKSLPLI